MLRRLWERFWWWRFRRVALRLLRRRMAEGETPDDALDATVLDVRQALKGKGLADPYPLYQASLRAERVGRARR